MASKIEREENDLTSSLKQGDGRKYMIPWGEWGTRHSVREGSKGAGEERIPKVLKGRGEL